MNERLILEDKITKFLQNDGKTVHFDCFKNLVSNDFDNSMTLTEFCVRVITFNVKTNEKFLLKEVHSYLSYENALEEIYSYISNNDIGNSYTVEWSKKSENKNISYFYCKNVLELAEKFFYDKNVDAYIIHSIKLNPIS
jgi:hypothetical protein